jgi:hypothetical protein
MFSAKVRATKDNCTRTSKAMQQTGNISNDQFAVASALMRRDAFRVAFYDSVPFVRDQAESDIHYEN